MHSSKSITNGQLNGTPGSVPGRELKPSEQAGLLCAALESTIDGLIVLDREDRVAFLNRRLADLLKVAPETLENKTGQELIAQMLSLARNADEFLQWFNRRGRSPDAESTTLVGLKDGRTLEVFTRPQWEEGGYVGVVFRFRDATERMRTREALRESQAIYDSLVAQLPFGIFRKDLEGNYVFVNSAFCGITGVSSEAVLGKSPVELASMLQNTPEAGKLGDRGREHHRSIAETGRPIEVEDEYLGADGKQKFYHTVKSPVFGPDGRIVGTQGVLIDITERKQAEQALLESRALYQSLVDELPAGVFRKDREGRYVFVNSWFCHLKKMGPERFLGKTTAEFAAAELAERPERRRNIDNLAHQGTSDHETILTTGKTIQSEEHYPAQDGLEELYLHVVKCPVYGPHSVIVGSQAILTDITQRKRAERELERVHRALMDASRQAGMAEVATSVLHNVGNVLNSINVSMTLISDAVAKSRIGNVRRIADLIQQHEGDLVGFLTNDPKGAQLPGYICQLAEHLATEQTDLLKEVTQARKHIEHVKEIVMMQQSYAKVCGVAEKVSASDLVEDALRMNADGLSRHRIEIAREYASELPEFSVDRHKVLQILVNLINNAKYACDESERDDKVLKVRISRDGGLLSIAVIDNGIGIPPENLTRIFNHGFTTRRTGHGFGLHSGALAAKELGGSLTVHSDGPGKGATFVLQLPLGSA